MVGKLPLAARPLLFFGVLASVWACAAERRVPLPQQHPQDQPCALKSRITGDALYHIYATGLVPGPEYLLEVIIETIAGQPVMEKTWHIALVNETSPDGVQIALPPRAPIAIFRIEALLSDRFPGLVGDDAVLSKRTWVEERLATHLKAQLKADCEYKTRISPIFVDAQPIICTHDVKMDWISQQLHEIGTYYTIEASTDVMFFVICQYFGLLASNLPANPMTAVAALRMSILRHTLAACHVSR